MATQAIRFVAPPGQTITLDVFSLSSDTHDQSGLTCTESTNRKGLYTTANFADTLSGRHYIVKKIGGVAFGSDFVMLLNGNGTYDSEDMTIGSDARKSRQWNLNKRTIDTTDPAEWVYTVFEDDAATTADSATYVPSTGDKGVT